MEISQSLVCPCNSKLYKTAASLKVHQKTNIHQVWEMPQRLKDLEIKNTKLENENGHLRRLNVLLLERIDSGSLKSKPSLC
jgi:hypothetical protein